MMKIILTKNVVKLGQRGELKNVRDGFYRNFLFPRGLALLPTPGRMKEVNERMKQMQLRKEQMKAQASELLKKLDKATVIFNKKATAKGKLYAAITQKHVADALAEQLKVHLPVEAIELSAHLKAVGKFPVNVRLNEEVAAVVNVEILPAKE